MKSRKPNDASRGFALMLVVVLLGLLVLAVYALGVLTRVQTQVTSAAGHQRQARQNALLALRIGLGELQRHAGPDARVTGMAGVTGVAAGGTRTTRHWCGVWSSEGDFVTWLASGAQSGVADVQPGLGIVKLAGEGSVGASVTNSEHVSAGLIPITVVETPATPGSPATIGAYAFVVLDEGVKVSARAPAGFVGPGGLRPVLWGETTSSAQGRLRAALETYDSSVGDVLSFEQLRLLPWPAKPLTPSTLQDNFHHVTLCALGVDGATFRAGLINLNTSSAPVWRSILATYNTAPGAEPIPATEVSERGEEIARGLASSTSGKRAGGPFTSVAAFGASELLAGHLPPAITPEAFIAAMAPVLTVRSDTFRIRGYGEVRAPLREGAVEAAAWCEAVVQRTSAASPDGHGRRFAIIHFRWLGPSDI